MWRCRAITHIIQIMPWIHSGDFAVDWTIRVDTITAVMLVVVTGVSSLVHLYSIGYMARRPAPAALLLLSCRSSPSPC